MRRGIVFNNDPALMGTEGCPPIVICPFCGAEQYTQGVAYSGNIYWIGAPQDCSCSLAQAAKKARLAEQAAAAQAQRAAREQDQLQRRVKQLIRNSGINQRFQGRTFETFLPRPELAAALRTAMAYAAGFPPPGGRNGLMIAGPPGVGKTHLAAAIAHELLHRGTPVICMTMIDLLGRIKSTYDGGATEDEVLSVYRQIPLLVMDDMGKEVATEWALAKIYAIINARYEAMRPLIVTTNYEGNRLIRRLTPRESGDSMTAEAILDRLREMCAGIVIRAGSWRDLNKRGKVEYEADTAQDMHTDQPPLPGGLGTGAEPPEV